MTANSNLVPVDLEAIGRSAYKSARLGVAPGISIAVICFSANDSVIVTGVDGNRITTYKLALAPTNLAVLYFENGPLMAMEIERAIMLVEDELMRVKPTFAKGTKFVTFDLAIHRLAQFVGNVAAPEVVLTLGHVEGIYQRLANAALGGAGSSGLPVDPTFAATLVVLREMMHHLDFDAVIVRLGLT